MTVTVKKLIKKSMQTAGILTKNQEPTADEYNDALDALNNLLSSLSNDSLFIYARTWETFPLSAGITAYTIGPGQTFNTVRPIDIVESYVRISGVSDFDLAIITDENYNQIQYKPAQGVPQWLNYDNAYPAATIRLFPVPSAAYSLFILSEKILSQFSINDTIDLPPGWERMLIFNLADDIDSDYGQEISQSAKETAVKSLAMIKKAVQKNHNLDAYPNSARENNIYTGYNQ